MKQKYNGARRLAAALGTAPLICAWAGSARSQTTTGCVNKTTGTLRIPNANSPCKKAETLLTWNAQGPVGLTLSILFSIIFSIMFTWNLNFRAIHLIGDWQYNYTLDQFTVPSDVLKYNFGPSQWHLESRHYTPWHLLHILCGQALGYKP